MTRVAKKKEDRRLYFLSVLCASGFMLFAYFLFRPFPWMFLSVLGVVMPTVIIANQINAVDKLSETFGVTIPHQKYRYLIIGFLVGVMLALSYRLSSGMAVMMESLGWFVVIAAPIGASEELIFRGFLQGFMKQIHPLVAIFGAAFSHAAYKFCLFLNQHGNTAWDLKYILLLTFVVGVFAGYLREKSGSVLPAVVGHVVFDVFVYGDSRIREMG